MEATQVCSVEACDRLATTRRGWCKGHYRRWQRLGDPGTKPIQKRAPVPIETRLCEAPGCDRKHLCHGYCSLHYQRWVKDLPLEAASFEESFWARVDKSGDCWLWTGTRRPDGYGKLTRDGRYLRAHRVAWELTHGPIPDEMTVDHLCFVRHCCNVDHLRLLTNIENATGGFGGNVTAAIQLAKTHCIRDHEFTTENTQWATGTNGRPRRICRACNRERKRRRLAKED